MSKIEDRAQEYNRLTGGPPWADLVPDLQAYCRDVARKQLLQIWFLTHPEEADELIEGTGIVTSLRPGMNEDPRQETA